MTAAGNAALVYHPEAYIASRPDIKGRHSAGAGFLQGFVRYAEVNAFYCYSEDGDPKHLLSFHEQINASNHRHLPSYLIKPNDVGALADVGCLMAPAPANSDDAWRRRHFGNRRYSLCGVTHTIASDGIMKAFAELLLAPFQSWDALICTSRSVKAAIMNYLEGWQDYYQACFDRRLPLRIQLPIIPLGVDCNRFEQGSAWSQKRFDFRQRLGIGETDIVILFFGRLSFHAKVHPVAQFKAVERVAGRVGATLHFVHVGHFYTESISQLYRASANHFCRKAKVHFADGSNPLVSEQAWAAADIFLSLSDNIQESFGLTPIEAMAASLPVVVSDWDGYRDTVIDGETGYRIRTVTPPPGNTVKLGRDFHLGDLDYDHYIGHACMVTAVDVEACAAALQRLVEDADLRRRMGEAGCRRAVQHYDWKMVIGAYQSLWAELAERRAKDSEVAPKPIGGSGYPAFPDPFVFFRHHPTAVLDPKWRISVADVDLTAELQQLQKDKVSHFAESLFLSREEYESLLWRCQDFNFFVGDVVAGYPEEIQPKVRNTLVWLMKMGMITMG